MEILQKPSRIVNPKRFERNCDAARRAGYNLYFRPESVVVNGVSVQRAYFEDCHPVVLIGLLDQHVGRGSRSLPVCPYEVNS